MKRFTETSKWDDPWFWGLSPSAKLLWLFLCDHCDNAGIIEISLKVASNKIGQSIKEQHLTELHSRLHALENGKTLIKGFIRFQHGTLSRDCKPHNPIFSSLSHNGINLSHLDPESKGYGNPFQKGSDTLQVQVKVKDQVKGKVQEGVQGEIYHKDSRTALHWLNEKSGHHYRETDTNLGFIHARLIESGVEIEGVKAMISRQCARWKGTEQAEYLRPETLFNKTKFDAYYASKDMPVRADNVKITPERNQLQERIEIKTL